MKIRVEDCRLEGMANRPQRWFRATHIPTNTAVDFIPPVDTKEAMDALQAAVDRYLGY